MNTLHIVNIIVNVIVGAVYITGYKYGGEIWKKSTIYTALAAPTIAVIASLASLVW